MSTQLFYALNRDDLDNARCLLEAGVDVNVVLREEGVAPMHLAAGLGTEAIQLLLEYAANPNIRSTEGFTPLHIAATWGEIESVRLLLYSGADPLVRDQDGFQPVDVAKTYGHNDCVCLLKYYSLLLFNNEEDEIDEPKYSRESLESVPCVKIPVVKNIQDNAVQDSSSDDWDSSCTHTPPNLYADVFQKQVYDSVRKGKNIFVDVTSPHHPTIHMKESARCSTSVGGSYPQRKAHGQSRRKTIKMVDSDVSRNSEIHGRHVYEYHDIAGNACGLNKVKASGRKHSNHITCSCDEVNADSLDFQEQSLQAICHTIKKTCSKNACELCNHQPATFSPHHNSLCNSESARGFKYDTVNYQQHQTRFLSPCQNNASHCNESYFIKPFFTHEQIAKTKALKSTPTVSTPPTRPLLDSLEKETPEAKMDRWHSSAVFDSKPVQETKNKCRPWFQPLTEHAHSCTSKHEPRRFTACINNILSQCSENGEKICLDVTSPNHPFLDTKASRVIDPRMSLTFDSSNSLFSETLDLSTNTEHGTEENSAQTVSPNPSPVNDKKPPIHPLKRFGMNNNACKDVDSVVPFQTYGPTSPVFCGVRNKVLNENQLELHRFLTSRQKCLHSQPKAEVEVKTESDRNGTRTDSTATEQRKMHTEMANTKMQSTSPGQNLHEILGVRGMKEEESSKVISKLPSFECNSVGIKSNHYESNSSVINDKKLDNNTNQKSSSSEDSSKVISEFRSVECNSVGIKSNHYESNSNVITDKTFDFNTNRKSSSSDATRDDVACERQHNLNRDRCVDSMAVSEIGNKKDWLPAGSEDGNKRLSDASVVSASSCDTFRTCEDDTDFTMVTRLNEHSKASNDNVTCGDYQTCRCNPKQRDCQKCYSHCDGNLTGLSVSNRNESLKHREDRSGTHEWVAPDPNAISDESDLITSDESFMNRIGENKLSYQARSVLTSSKNRNGCQKTFTASVVKSTDADVEKTPTNVVGRNTLSCHKHSDSSCKTTVCHKDHSKHVFESSNAGQQKTPIKSRKQLFPQMVFEIQNTQSQNHDWQAPKNIDLDDSDLMTSDESFLLRNNDSVKIPAQNIGDLVNTFDKVHVQSPQHKMNVNVCRIKASEERVTVAPSVNSILNRRLSAVTLSSATSSVTSSPDPLDVGFCKRSSLDSVYSHLSCKEYVYKDADKGVVLIERHIPSDYEGSIDRQSIDSLFSVQTVDTQGTELYDWKAYQSDHNESNDEREGKTKTRVSVPETLSQLSNDEVREKLKSLGDEPGPIVTSTRQLYLVRLASLQLNPHHVHMLKLTDSAPDYSHELRLALQDNLDLSDMQELEIKMVAPFDNPQGRKWREGTIKSSFNYLLLDPRVTKNLPLRAKHLGDLETFKIFIAAIFYVGKGKRSRPYSHLYEAISHTRTPKPKTSSKVQHIVDIWQEGVGVVSLHCFQSTIPVEAYTREACMVEAFGLPKLTNMKRGDFYGTACSWSLKMKRKMGVYLLKKALQIFLSDGERQICPYDIKQGQ